MPTMPNESFYRSRKARYSTSWNAKNWMFEVCDPCGHCVTYLLFSAHRIIVVNPIHLDVGREVQQLIIRKLHTLQ